MKRSGARGFKRTVKLYDFGAGGMFTLVLGIPVLGSIIDGIWNYLVLSLTLRPLTKGMPVTDPPARSDLPYWLPKSDSNGEITREDKVIYTIIITLIGFIVDAIYVFMIWDPFAEGQDDIWWQSRIDAGLQFFLMIVPISLLAFCNYGLASRFLELPQNKAWILGIVMALFTAPWLLVIVPRYH